MTSVLKSKLYDSAKTLLWGTAWIIGACFYWYSIFGNPLDELALIQRGRTVPGFIVQASEDLLDGDEGGARWVHWGTYKYRLPDGREFAGKTGDMPGRLQEEIKDPYPIEVEYLPDNPLVSRIKGYGEDTVRNWLWHNVVLGSLAFLVIASPGIILLKSAFGKTRPVERSTGRPYTKEQLDHSTRIFISGGGTEKAALESQAYLEQAPTEDESDSISPTAQKEELAKALGVPVEGLDAKLAELGSGVSRVTPGTPEDVAVGAEAIQNNLGKASEEQKARLAKAFEVPVEQLDTYLAELKARINARYSTPQKLDSHLRYEIAGLN